MKFVAYLNNERKADDMDSSTRLEEIMRHPQASQIYEAVDMFCYNDTDAEEIADYLNNCQLRTFSGNKNWKKEEVLKVIHDVKHDRFLFFKIVCGCE